MRLVNLPGAKVLALRPAKNQTRPNFASDYSDRLLVAPLLRTLMVGQDADALGAGVASMGIFLLMAVVLLIRPKGLFVSNA